MRSRPAEAKSFSEQPATKPIQVCTPVVPGDDADAAAERRAIDFVKALFPHLGTHLPL